MQKPCNHVWRNTPLPTPKCSTEELLSAITESCIHGWWLKEEEVPFAKELASKGLIRFCVQCGEPFKAAFVIAKKEKKES